MYSETEIKAFVFGGMMYVDGVILLFPLQL